MKIPLSQIQIGERQRLDLGDIEELAESLSRLGQIHNIGLTPDNRLIWGRRRLEAAKHLGWTEIEAVVKEGLTNADEQTLELEEDIRRKNRTWQEETIAVAKLFAIKAREARSKGESFGVREMAAYTGIDKQIVAEYVFKVAIALAAVPKDAAVWEAQNYSTALQILRGRVEREAAASLHERHEAARKTIEAAKATGIIKPSPVSNPDSTEETEPPKPVRPLTLRDRAMLYNQKFAHLGPPNTDLFYSFKNGREFITGFWFVGGGNISELYGSYQTEYLKRIETLFPDAKQVVHLFVGNLPPSPNYVRVGLPQGEYKPDIECDAHNLSSHLPFKADLLYADPPYSIEDSEHYQNAMVNRERVLEECALVLSPSGYIVWIDQALPLFKNDQIQLVGAIGYIRSTGNRFRIISIFKRVCQTTTSEPSKETTPAENQPE